jgi:hypothetical protein
VTTARDFIAQLQGQNPDSTILVLTGDQFYEVESVATPVADATVLVVAPEPSQHEAATSAAVMVQDSRGDTASTTPSDSTSETDAAPALQTEAPKADATSGDVGGTVSTPSVP